MEQNETNPALQIMRSRIEDLLAIQTNTKAIEDSLTTIASNIVSNSLPSAELLSNILEDMAQAIMQIAQMGHETCHQLAESIEIPEGTLEPLRELAPLVPEDKREEFEEIVAPEKAAEKKILTIENIKWLLGIILPILFTFYMNQLPDKTAEEHNQLHREEIATQQEEIELRKEEIKLFREFFDYVKENGIGLPEQVDVVPEHVETIDEDVDALHGPDLPDPEANDHPDQPPGQDSQD